MSSPSIFPITKDGKRLSYFEVLCDNAKQFLPELELNFDGYTETVERYKMVELDDKEENYALATELNAWSEYFSDLANIIQNQYLDAETDKLNIQAKTSIEHNAKTVSVGDRYSNTDPEVIRARKKRNALKSLYDALVSKQEFTEKAFYQCKSNYSREQKIEQKMGD